MREQFEKFPEIMGTLNRVEWDNDVKRYRPINSDKDVFQAAKINGAWYAFQEQQKKLQAVYDDCTEFTTASELLDSIKELLK